MILQRCRVAGLPRERSAAVARDWPAARVWAPGRGLAGQLRLGRTGAPAQDQAQSACGTATGSSWDGMGAAALGAASGPPSDARA
eukprot:1511465-Pyramimonas_sp.AAC.1